MDDCAFDSEEDPELNLRVKNELEALNIASESINKLENEVQKARNKFRNLKSDSSQQLNTLYKKIGRRFIIKSRPYYDLILECNKIQVEVQKASLNFQKANGMYKAAKETVTLAESKLIAEDGLAIKFDSAWQELLNQANLKFNEAKIEKSICEEEHLKKAADYSNLQNKMASIYNDNPRAIYKAKPFYELKGKLESKLKAERQNAEDLHLALLCSKQRYKMALQSLEQISDQVHRQRQISFNLPMRTPGVGAECDTCSQFSEMPSCNLDIMSEADSTMSAEDMLDMDIELSMQDLEMADPQSPDKSFDFWSKINNKLKVSASAATFPSTEEFEQNEHRHGKLESNNFNDFQTFSSDNIRTIETMKKRSAIVESSAKRVFNNQAEKGANRSARRNYGFLGDDKRKGILIIDKKLNEPVVETDDDFADIKRRATFGIEDDYNVDEDKRNTLICDDEDRRKTITNEEFKVIEHRNRLSNYDDPEWRSTILVNEDDDDCWRISISKNELGRDVVENMKQVGDDVETMKQIKMPLRDSMVEGAEDSISNMDLKSKSQQSLTYNLLNDKKLVDSNFFDKKQFVQSPSVSQSVNKPPNNASSPFLTSGILRSGVHVPISQRNNVQTSNKKYLQDLSIKNLIETEKELPAPNKLSLKHKKK